MDKARQEATEKQVREAFRAWCAREGYTPLRRRVRTQDSIGSAFLRRHYGRYSVEIATPYGCACPTIESGGTLFEESAEVALAFFGGGDG